MQETIDALIEQLKKVNAENENLKFRLSLVMQSLPSDTDIENWFFHKLGKRETMTEKEYLFGMIMAKHIRDEWENKLGNVANRFAAKR